jgi:hypothetical protein
VYAPFPTNKTQKWREREKEKEISRSTSLASQLSSMSLAADSARVGGAVVLEKLAARVEENLLGCHVVVVEKSGEDTGLLVDTLLWPELLAFGEIRDRVVAISTGRATRAAASEARSARRYRCSHCCRSTGQL